MHCEFYVTTDCQPVHSMTYSMQSSSQNSHAVGLLCSSVVGPVLGSTPSCDVASIMDYCADNVPMIADLFAAADQSLFKRMLNNEQHVA